MAGKKLGHKAVLDFANEELAKLHNARVGKLNAIQLQDIIEPRDWLLFGAQNIVSANSLTTRLLDEYFWDCEVALYNTFLVELAIFVATECWGGKKSSAEGLDLEFDKDETRYLVAIKSGQNWGNSSQWQQLEDNFKRALKVQRQSRSSREVRAVLGQCYGKKRLTDRGFYHIITGQQFWHFLSGDESLYLDIIEPIGHQARQHNEDFFNKRAALENRFTVELARDFCKPDYSIDWGKLVAFNSGNIG